WGSQSNVEGRCPDRTQAHQLLVETLSERWRTDRTLRRVLLSAASGRKHALAEELPARKRLGGVELRNGLRACEWPAGDGKQVFGPEWAAADAGALLVPVQEPHHR